MDRNRKKSENFENIHNNVEYIMQSHNTVYNLFGISQNEEQKYAFRIRKVCDFEIIDEFRRKKWVSKLFQININFPMPNQIEFWWILFHFRNGNSSRVFYQIWITQS